MGSPEVFYTIGYGLFAACMIAPPTEFVSIGLTIQNLLSNYLGSEDVNFIHYHMKRTSATVVFHAFLPLGYFIGLCLMNHDLTALTPWNLSLFWQFFLLTSTILPIAAIVLAYSWKRNKYGEHPIAKALAVYVPQDSSWHAVASSVNVEFRRIDKFTTGIPGRRIIVSDSWVMRTSTYFVHVAHQNDVHLTLEKAEEHDLSHETSSGVQYLTIAVNNIHPGVPRFTIRLLATEYQDLKDKLHTQVRNLRNVVIQQSMSDRFLQAFREQVARNPVVRKTPELEVDQCIGCMQVAANVKLQKYCDNPSVGTCVQCFCRPMWCMECMGKWFGSRQDQNAPETWMASKSPCPTCRAVFCLLDVCNII